MGSSLKKLCIPDLEIGLPEVQNELCINKQPIPHVPMWFEVKDFTCQKGNNIGKRFYECSKFISKENRDVTSFNSF